VKDRVLVTGAQGFLGRYLVVHLLASDPQTEVLGVGRSVLMPDTFTHAVSCGDRTIRAPLLGHLKTDDRDRYRYLPLNIQQKTEIRETLHTFRPNVIVHLASSLRGCSADEYLQTIMGGTVALIEAIAESGLNIEKLVMGSTGGVYGAPADEELPLKETSSCNPVDFYGVSKLAAEHASRVLCKQYGIPMVVARIFNLVGAGQQEIHICGRLATQIAAIISGALPPLIRVGSLAATRDFIDVRDAAVGLELIARKGSPGEAYNLGTGQETAISAVLATFLSIAGLSQVPIERLEELRPTVLRHFATIEKLRSLGFQPAYDFRQSAEGLLHYYVHDVAHTAFKMTKEN